MKGKDPITFKQKMRNIRRGYGLCHELAPGFVARRCAVQATKVLSQYAGIYLSGSIVGILTEHRDFSGAVKAALWYVGVCLFFDTLMVLFDAPKYEQQSNGFQVRAKMLLARKCMDMDFVRVENPETHRKKQAAENYLFGGGSRQLGIGKLFFDTHKLFQFLFSALVGIGVCFPTLFLKKPNAAGAPGFLQSPFAVLLLILLCAVLIFLQQKTYHHIQEMQSGFFSDKDRNQEERIAGFYVNFVRGRYQRGKDIRIYDQSKLLIGEWEKHNDSYLKFGQKLVDRLRPADWGSPVFTMALSLLTYAFFIARAVSGMNSAAETVVLVMSVGNVINSVTDLLGMAADFSFAVVNIGCVFEFLDLPDEKYKGTIPTEKRDDNKYEFAFCHVSFKYPGSDRYVLKDVNLTWRIGEKMALVGRNGSGKSTIVKLLCRLYDPTEGEITLNGIDIRKYNYEEYMALFSVVFQDSKLFSFSVAENVAADTVYDGGRVEECVRRAGLSEWLEAMPAGVETCIYKDFDEKGVEISGGEAQKLCLARAIYKGAPFIVLDEPTAALDPVSEHDIYTKFNSIVGTRTAIYISHRLSSCRFCDDITVLDNGRIVEKGSHSDLLKRQGIYAALWAAQAEYYQETAGEDIDNHRNIKYNIIEMYN